MPKYYVLLKLCDGEAGVGPFKDAEEARQSLLRSAAYREKHNCETWRSTSHLKWASTNGHTLEVIEK